MTNSIKVGVIADQTGPFSPMGGAQANVATLVVDEINASGGVLGRRLELILEDGASDDEQAAAKAAKLAQEDQVDVLLGGILSSTRQAIKAPAVEEGETLYIYPEQYEGQEYHSLLFCTGAVPAQQVEPLIPWVMQQTGARTFYLPSADYIWPQAMNRKLHEVASHSPTRPLWHRSASWPAPITSGSTAAVTTARRSPRGSGERRVSSPPPTPTRRCGSGGRIGRRSRPTTPRPSCCATRKRAVSARTRSTPCSLRLATAW